MKKSKNRHWKSCSLLSHSRVILPFVWLLLVANLAPCAESLRLPPQPHVLQTPLAPMESTAPTASVAMWQKILNLFIPGRNETDGTHDGKTSTAGGSKIDERGSIEELGEDKYKSESDESETLYGAGLVVQNDTNYFSLQNAPKSVESTEPQTLTRDDAVDMGQEKVEDNSEQKEKAKVEEDKVGIGYGDKDTSTEIKEEQLLKKSDGQGIPNDSFVGFGDYGEGEEDLENDANFDSLTGEGLSEELLELALNSSTLSYDAGVDTSSETVYEASIPMAFSRILSTNATQERSKFSVPSHPDFVGAPACSDVVESAMKSQVGSISVKVFADLIHLLEAEKAHEKCDCDLCQTLHVAQSIRPHSYDTVSSLVTSSRPIDVGILRGASKNNIRKDRLSRALLDKFRNNWGKEISRETLWRFATCEVDTFLGRTLVQEIIVNGLARSLSHSMFKELWKIQAHDRGAVEIVDRLGNNILHLAVLSSTPYMVVALSRHLVLHPRVVVQLFEGKNVMSQQPRDLVNMLEGTIRPSMMQYVKALYTTSTLYIKFGERHRMRYLRKCKEGSASCSDSFSDRNVSSLTS